MTRLFTYMLLILGLTLPLIALAQSDAQPTATNASEPIQLDTVVVTGALPAPGLWELIRDSKRVLIMGTLTPAPREMTWYSPRVESRVAQAQEVLGPPGVSVSADVGVFRGLLLIPSYQRSKKNPDGKRLQNVLPPATYVRWQAAKARYLGGDRSVDALRPVHAAKVLFDAAVRQVGLSDEDRVDPVIRRVAKEHSIPVRTTTLRLTIKDPKKTLKQLSATSLNDVPCMEQTLDRLNIDLQTMLTRANAWAEGDMERLRALPFIDQHKVCLGAMGSNEIARAQGIGNLDAEILGSWIKSLRASLATHDVVFATFPVGRLEGADGVIEALRAEGFSVKAPQ